MNATANWAGIPNYLQIFCALHFFGHGSYQLDVGNGGNSTMSQPSVSHCIVQVSEVIIARLLNTWIHFPSTVVEISNKKLIFSEEYQFLHTIGAIEGTHVAIVTPPINHPVYPAASYLNIKGFYSINVQIISGSVHDAIIWMISNINQSRGG